MTRVYRTFLAASMAALVLSLGLVAGCPNPGDDDVGPSPSVTPEVGGESPTPAVTPVQNAPTPTATPSSAERDQDADGFSPAAGDCDDHNNTVFPGADEVAYDGIDQDCDGEDLTDADSDGQDATLAGGQDCNDADPTIYAGATETPYDGIDQDCDGLDLVDVDEDGYIAVEAGGVDCIDTDPNSHPGAAEYADGADNDCDGLVDEDLDTTDDDQDGYAESDGDCNDADPAIHPDAEDIPYDGVDQDCSGSDLDDLDGDGFPGGTDGTDCNDNDATVYPGAEDTPYDDIDQDCSGSDTVDADGDGFAAQETGGTDCDDTNADINPDAPEVCDGVDNDCDNGVDTNPTDGTPYYADLDQDGFGDPNSALLACTQPDAYVTDNTDCDDTRADAYPGAPEICNGLDDDCDCAGQTDQCVPDIDEGVMTTFYQDADGDTYGDLEHPISACTQPAGASTNSLDCNDANETIHPDAQEVCNGTDDDCDGDVDEDLPQYTYFLDADGDGFGDPSTSLQSCSTVPDGYSATALDCDDTDATVNPTAAETCNGADDNCNGETDEGVLQTWYVDADGDGYGDADQSTLACTQPEGYVADNSDCLDSDPAVNPGASEVCNGRDDNCNLDADEGLMETYYLDADQDGFGSDDVTTEACSPPGGYILTGGDCADTDATVYPGAEEILNLRDDNCNGEIDEGVNYPTCKAIHQADPTLPDGFYRIDPDGTETAYAPVEVYCDMTIDGGGWTRFWWVLGDYGSVEQDPFGKELSECASDDDVCLARIPSVINPDDFMIKDVNEGHYGLWHFDSNNAISNAALAAFRDHQQSCKPNTQLWNPYHQTDTTENWCGNGGEGGCDSFFYQKNGTCGNRTGSGWSAELDGDTGCYAAAFKVGRTQPGYEPQCSAPDNNFLDDGPSDSDDKLGEMYFR